MGMYFSQCYFDGSVYHLYGSIHFVSFCALCLLCFHCWFRLGLVFSSGCSCCRPSIVQFVALECLECGVLHHSLLLRVFVVSISVGCRSRHRSRLLSVFPHFPFSLELFPLERFLYPHRCLGVFFLPFYHVRSVGFFISVLFVSWS